MNELDPEMAARVWRRVRGETPPSVPSPIPPSASREPSEAAPELLIAQALADAAAYSALARRYAGRENLLLRRLAQEDRAQAACLRGICALTGGVPATAAPSGSHLPPRALLGQCYNRELARFRAYTARADDPSFGPVFARLAGESREHCALVLEILGR